MVIQFDGEYYAPVLPTDTHLNHLKQDAPKYLHPMMASDFESICYIAHVYTYDNGNPASTIQILGESLDIQQFPPNRWIGKLQAVVVSKTKCLYRSCLIPLTQGKEAAHMRTWQPDWSVVTGGTLCVDGEPVLNDMVTLVSDEAAVTIGDSLDASHNLSWVWYHGRLYQIFPCVQCGVKSLKKGKLLQTEVLWEYQEAAKAVEKGV